MNSMQFSDWNFTTWSGNGYTNHCVNYRGRTGYKFSSQNWSRGQVNILTRSFDRTTYSPAYFGQGTQQTSFPLYYHPHSGNVGSYAMTGPSSPVISGTSVIPIYSTANSNSDTISYPTTATATTSIYSSTISASNSIVSLYPPENGTTIASIHPSTRSTDNSVVSLYPQKNSTTSTISVCSSTNSISTTLTSTNSLKNPTPTAIPIDFTKPPPNFTVPPPKFTIPPPMFTVPPPLTPNTSEYTPVNLPLTEYTPPPPPPPPSPVPIPPQNTIVYVPTSTVNFTPTYVEGYQPTHIAGYIPAKMTALAQVPGCATTPMLVNQVYYGNVPVYAYQPVQDDEEGLVNENDDEGELENESDDEGEFVNEVDDENKQDEVEGSNEKHDNEIDTGTKEDVEEVKNTCREEYVDNEKVEEVPQINEEENICGGESLDEIGAECVPSAEQNYYESVPYTRNNGTFNERYPHYNNLSLPFYEGVNYVALPYAGNNYVPLPVNQHFEEMENQEEGEEDEDHYEYTLGDFPLLNMPEL